MNKTQSHDLLHLGVKLLRDGGAEYGDVRQVRTDRELLFVRNGLLDPAVRNTDAGFGVRVLLD